MLLYRSYFSLHVLVHRVVLLSCGVIQFGDTVWVYNEYCAVTMPSVLLSRDGHLRAVVLSL